ncbi:hypothetical protein GCM10009836_03340 [Pseudonocardia ailaonensis]|uniref:Uncharacterized protein n=1 Tax=Pseudonocardia ailaonensis TaxID=367279 RepID=A0ABN2MJU0_9PSEU
MDGSPGGPDVVEDRVEVRERERLWQGVDGTAPEEALVAEPASGDRVGGGDDVIGAGQDRGRGPGESCRDHVVRRAVGAVGHPHPATS